MDGGRFEPGAANTAAADFLFGSYRGPHAHDAGQHVVGQHVLKLAAGLAHMEHIDTHQPWQQQHDRRLKRAMSGRITSTRIRPDEMLPDAG